MTPSSVSLPVLPSNRHLRLTPKDISQFVRLEQCERIHRLRLAERTGQDFMREYDVTPQRITPLLSLSGHEFAEGVEKALSTQFRTVHYAAAVTTLPSAAVPRRCGYRRSKFWEAESEASLGP